MKKIAKAMLLAFSVCALLCFWQSSAEATRQFAVTQVTAPADFPMGVAQSMTFTITNTCNAGNAGEVMTRVQFNVSGTYTLFPPQTITVAGWTCTLSNATGSNYRRITCSANTTADRIPSGSSRNFTFNIINNPAYTYDRIAVLSSVVGSFWTGTRTRTITRPNQGSWTWRSLLMALVPASVSVGNGCQFTLTMTVTNRTSVALAVAPVPSPRPTANTAGANINSPNPVPNPPTLNLNAGTSGTITWVYTLTDTGAAGGSVSFTACASTTGSCTTVSGASRTSSSITSATVALNPALICGFNVSSFTNNPACLYSGSTANFVMVVSNTSGAAVNNVVPSALVPVLTGAAAFGAFAGPVPASIATINSGATGTFTWTAPVTGNPNDNYSVQGNATANGGLVTPTVTSTVQDVDGYLVPDPSPTNAESADAEIMWSVTNWACSNINQVAITIPGGWTFANDAYSVVTNTTGAQVEWPAVGTTFTSPSALDRIPPTGSAGAFSLLFSQTPNAPGNYIFNVTITDDVGVVRVYPTTVVVNPFKSGGLNDTGTGIWFENIR